MDLSSWFSQLPECRAHFQRYKRFADGFEHLVQGLEMLQPEEAPRCEEPESHAEASAGEALSGIAAVRAVMAAAPDRAWDMAGILDEMQRRGWLDPHAEPPRATIQSAFFRLRGTGEIVAVARGMYRWAEGVESPTAS
jgi:hypothetical protein